MSVDDLLRLKALPLGEWHGDEWLMIAQARGLTVGEGFRQAPASITCGYSYFLDRWRYVARCRVTIGG